ncbi:MAG: hypothetical protein OXG08_08015 [Gammaproteobacteria bacterium]|nr:hypothetical protein [Gammaproteobacteria bacterium]
MRTLLNPLGDGLSKDGIFGSDYSLLQLRKISRVAAQDLRTIHWSR